MGYSEFPHFFTEDDDMHEFIHMYQELVSKYSGTLESIKALDARLTKYENDMNSRIANLIDVVIPEKVSSAVELEMRHYEDELRDIRNSIGLLETELGTLNSKVDLNDTRIRNRITAEVSVLEGKILELREEVLTELNSAIETVNTRITEVQESLQAEDERIESKLDHFIANFEVHERATLLKAKEYTDEQCNELRDMINELQPVTARKRCKWLWDYGCNFGGYSAIQWYNDTTVTAGMWHETQFTCVDWYVRGRELWNFFDRCRFMFSPISGRFVNVRTVLLELITKLKWNKALTAEAYEKLNISAETYDDGNISGYEYDWNGKEILKNVLKGN